MEDKTGSVSYGIDGEKRLSTTDRSALKLRASKLMVLGIELLELATVNPDELRQLCLIKKLFLVGVQPDEEVLFDKVEIDDLLKDATQKLQPLMK